jgi:hypothetical protein
MSSPASHLFADLPADTAFRFRLVAEAVRECGTHIEHRPRLLDVGGYPGTFARAFRAAFPRWQTHTVDRPAEELADYTSGSGTELPFEDGSFDVVTSVDTLEHVPPAQRRIFLAELCRVSARFVIVAAPFHHPATERVERQLNDCHRRLFRTPHPWLDEHVQNGLPRLKDVLEAWPADYGVVQARPSYGLGRWMLWQSLWLARQARGDVDTAWEHWNTQAAAGEPPPPDPIPYRLMLVAERRRQLQVRAAEVMPPPEAGEELVALGNLLTTVVGLLGDLSGAAGEGMVARAVEERVKQALEAAETELRSLRARQSSSEAIQRTSGLQSLLGIIRRPGGGGQ